MVTTTVYAQESNAQRRADRKAQRDAERARLKAEQQAADAVSYDDAVAALKAQKFVLEANQVMFRNGQTAFVTSNTNFVLVIRHAVRYRWLSTRFIPVLTVSAA